MKDTIVSLLKDGISWLEENPVVIRKNLSKIATKFL